MAGDRGSRGRSSSPGQRRASRLPRVLTRDRAIAMQDALIGAFSDPTFQQKLRGALWEASGDTVRQMRVRHEVCLPVQTPVVKQFGFDSVADSIEAFTPELSKDPEVAERRRVLDGLVGVRDAVQSTFQLMPSVMQVFAAVPSQHQSNFRLGATGPPASSSDVLARASSPVIIRAFSAEPGRHPSSKSPGPARRAKFQGRHRSASKSKRMVRVPMLSRETAIALQDALIAEFEKPEFQRTLRRAINMAGDDESARMRARQILCVPVQQPVVRRFGFLDIAESMLAFTPELDSDEEVAKRRARLDELVNPTEHAGHSDEHPAAALEPWKQAEVGPMPGQLWRVIGGRKLGGIVPRRGKELSSALLGTRQHPTLLETGAVVQELELYGGERLHYKKVSGEGPEYGWISLESVHTGNKLLERLTGQLEVLEDKKVYVRFEPTELSDYCCIAGKGDIIEVFRQEEGGLQGDYARLTPRQVYELGKRCTAEPSEAYVRVDKYVQFLPQEDGDAEVLSLTDAVAPH